MKINFTKMHGCGNDFILIDNRANFLQRVNFHELAKKLCMRRFHIGANGLMILGNSHVADFSMRYFNRDGSEGEMCGNGARCIAKFAYLQGIATNDMHFATADGIYEATVLEDGDVQIRFPDVPINMIQLKQKISGEGVSEIYHYAVVGVPHAVIFKQNILEIQENSFEKWARGIRYNKQLFPNGTNVNIVQVKSKYEVSIRTYERGVEEETLACGSGATAAAIISALLNKATAPVQVETKGGMLTIVFKRDRKQMKEITLTGNAVIAFTGSLNHM